MPSQKAIIVELEAALENLDHVREAISRTLDWASNAYGADDIAKEINASAALFVNCNNAIEDIVCSVKEYTDPGL